MDERGLSEADVASLLGEHGVTFTRGARQGEAIDSEYVFKRRSSDVP